MARGLGPCHTQFTILGKLAPGVSGEVLKSPLIAKTASGTRDLSTSCVQYHRVSLGSKVYLDPQGR